MPIEIKSGQTFASDWLQGLHQWLPLAAKEAHNPKVIYGGEESWKEGEIQILPWYAIGDL